MATILSIAELKSFTSITATDAEIESKKLIETVETRLPQILNNYFVSNDVYVLTSAIFNATARSITIDQTSWEEYGFQAGDDLFIYNSIRNEGYKKILSLTNNVAILATAYSAINESYSNNLSKSILFSLVTWPMDVKLVAAEMCYYDFDVRNKISANIKSRSLGPLSESYSDNSGSFGYPAEILNKLDHYHIARVI
jgi:hypothetical protein